MNILSNFIPYETIVCGNTDPLWYNKAMKSLIQEEKDVFEKYHISNNNIQLLRFHRFLRFLRKAELFH